MIGVRASHPSVTKLAPKRLQAMMMGMWFLSLALANFGSAEHTFVFPGLPGFFLLLVLLPLVGGIAITALSPALRKMMHGIH